MASFLKKTMVYLGLVDDDYDDYEPYEDQQPVRRTHAPEPEPVTSGLRTIPHGVPSGPIDQPSGITVQPRPAVVRPITRIEQAKVHLVEPANFGEAQEVGDRYKDGQPVIVNLTSVDPELRRRMVDFCSGITYALEGQMKQVSRGVYLLTPANVEVSAEDRRRLQERGLMRP